MGTFRSDRNRSGGRSGGFGRGGGGRSRGGRGFGDRVDSGDFRGRRSRPQMNEVTCDKCGKQCEVPFRPTGDKPVFCSNCFRKEGGSNSRDSDRGSFSSGSGISQGQYQELNTKLDKILGILESIEFEEDEEEEEA